ncbi:MAG: hypothetical protein EBR02_09550 [Alphaproteobacteria bacterium]|nr:hypothetical protein [Alphaproteobacteria bacterium]
MKSFASRVKNDELIYCVTGKHKGEFAWYYVRVDKLKHEMFKKASATGSFDIADFGTVLISGYGKEPPADIKKKFDEGKWEE